jgi:hypothetical protein
LRCDSDGTPLVIGAGIGAFPAVTSAPLVASTTNAWLGAMRAISLVLRQIAGPPEDAGAFLADVLLSVPAIVNPFEIRIRRHAGSVRRSRRIGHRVRLPPVLTTMVQPDP